MADFDADAKPDVAVSGTAGSNGGLTGLRVALNASGTLAPIVFYQFPPLTSLRGNEARRGNTVCHYLTPLWIQNRRG